MYVLNLSMGSCKMLTPMDSGGWTDESAWETCFCPEGGVSNRPVTQTLTNVVLLYSPPSGNEKYASHSLCILALAITYMKHTFDMQFNFQFTFWQVTPTFNITFNSIFKTLDKTIWNLWQKENSIRPFKIKLVKCLHELLRAFNAWVVTTF